MSKMKPSKSSRLRDAVITLLVTPLNLSVIGLKVIWRGRKLRLAGLTITAALLLTAVFRIDRLAPMAEQVEQAMHRSTAAAGFKVNDITVDGRMRTQRGDLLAAIGLKQGSPIFAADLDAMHARIEDLPWIEQAVVMRRLPNIVHVSLTERKPFALHRDGELLTLIDREGVAITTSHLRPFAHLPVFSGDGVKLRAAGFMDRLVDYPVLRNRMVAAHWTGGRRWTLSLDHGGEVHLPEGDITGALKRLMKLERERRILAIENQAIDLRLPDRVLLRQGTPTERSSRSNSGEVPS